MSRRSSFSTSETTSLRSRTLGLKDLPAAEREQLAREGRGALAGVLDLAERGPEILVVRELRLHQLRVAEDDREEVVEVVRDAAREAADRFHLLGDAELGFELLVFRQVPRVDDQPPHAGLGRKGPADERQGPPGAVAVADPGFQLLELGARLEAPPELALREGTIVGMDEIEGAASRKVRARIAENALPRGTGVAHLAVGRDDGHDVESIAR